MWFREMREDASATFSRAVVFGCGPITLAERFKSGTKAIWKRLAQRRYFTQILS
jgi:hypothetical protein